MPAGVVDPRTLCGLNHCPQRATLWIAFPKVGTKPLCQSHWDGIRFASDEFKNGMSPDQWAGWCRSHFKPITAGVPSHGTT